MTTIHIVAFRWTNSDQFKVSTKDADTLILFLAWWLLILLVVPFQMAQCERDGGMGKKEYSILFWTSVPLPLYV